MSFSQDLSLTVDGSAVNTGMAQEDPLIRAAIVSLFTWRRANADDITEGQKMGWWGDLTAEVANDRIGSRLWLLSREKMLPATINRAREYAQEALAWMVEDGLASRIDVQAERFGATGIALAATIYRSDGKATSLRFDNVWETIRNAV